MEYPKFKRQLELGNLRFFIEKKDGSYHCLYLPAENTWEKSYAFCVNNGKIIGGNGSDELGRQHIIRLKDYETGDNLIPITFYELTPTANDLFLKTIEEVL